MSNAPPKLFISYSWTSPEHQEWVLQLGTELRTAGVDVILDKWDLREGNDALAFMEKMVTDPEVQKVILVCDQKYSEKADGRSGGVGTEAQIISPKIYGRVDQNKFVAVVSETNPEGRPFLPAYYQSRIYIDLSTGDLYAINFEQLLRWIYGKPLYVKPRLGSPPAFIAAETPILLGTNAEYRRALDALKSAKPYARGALVEYLAAFSERLENFRIDRDSTKQFDDQVIENIDLFIPHRNEFISIVSAVAQHNDSEDVRESVHRFLERLIPYAGSDADNFAFIVHELFLYLVAELLKHQRFQFVGYLLRQPYYVESRNGEMVSFTAFRVVVSSLDRRNARLNLRRLSLHSDLLEQRSKVSGISFSSVMQADIVLFIRDCLDAQRKSISQEWWPETLMYADQSGPFEIFARAQSARYFENLKALFDIGSKTDLENMMTSFQSGLLQLPVWGHSRPNMAKLMGFKALASNP